MREENVFLSLNKKEDWEKGITSGLDISESGLTLRMRPGKNAGSHVKSGTFISFSLDGMQEGTVWSRVSCSYELMEDTYINISFFSSDSPVIEDDGKPLNIDAYLADGSVSAGEKIARLERYFKNTVTNAADAIVMNTTGRYLWLRIDILGTGSHAPVLSRVRLYPNYSSYLRYLPEVYQEDEESKDFLERYLAIFQSFFMEMEEDIEYSANWFDPDITPQDFLEWLAGCVGIDDVGIWGREKLRGLIKNAFEIYREKGTRKGISDIITHYTGEEPFIIEYSQYCNFLDPNESGDVLSRLYSGNPYVFIVLVRQEVVPDAERSRILSRIIDRQKPAHTEGRLVVLKPSICLDSYTYLGINTYLTEHTVIRLDNNTSLPYNAILAE